MPILVPADALMRPAVLTCRAQLVDRLVEHDGSSIVVAAAAHVANVVAVPGAATCAPRAIAADCPGMHAVQMLDVCAVHLLPL